MRTSSTTDNVTAITIHKSKAYASKYPPEKIVNKTDVVRMNIWNAGTLPTKDVTFTIATQSDNGKLAPYHVNLNPATDFERVVEDSNLVVRFKNPLGPNSHIQAVVTFDTVVDNKEIVKGFSPTEAFVDSEMGSATLIANVAVRAGGGNY